MHSYLSAIGFSNISKEGLDNIIYEAIRKPDNHELAFDSDGNEMVELSFQVCDNVGIAIRGVYDMDDNFKVDYYFPYCESTDFSTTADLEIIKQSDRECYQGFCDEVTLGVNLIFYLRNMMEFLQKSHGKNQFFDDNFRRTSLTGLSLGGKILLPVAEPQTRKPSQNSTDRTELVVAAREGDEDAIETLTLEDMDTYAMISKRVAREDVYSIVTTSFMPYGIENDKYSVIGIIQDVRRRMNLISREELYILKVNANDLTFDICINQKDLLGEPAVGRRFKGNVWMQGRVEF
jgi:hypothetical protein